MDGRRVQSSGELYKFSVYKPSDGVNGNEYHVGFGGNQTTGIKSDVLKGRPLYEMGLNIPG